MEGWKVIGNFEDSTGKMM